MKIQILMLRQDDPKKCTATKLVKFGLAKEIKKPLHNTVLLDPFAESILIPTDKNVTNSITAIDCSWNHASQTFTKKIRGIKRKLPPLFAGNPTNYSKIGKLTTVEALAGAAYILGYKAHALKLLDKFKWGHTFFELNKNLLNDFSQVKTTKQIDSILKEYGISV